MIAAVLFTRCPDWWKSIAGYFFGHTFVAWLYDKMNELKPYVPNGKWLQGFWNGAVEQIRAIGNAMMAGLGDMLADGLKALAGMAADLIKALGMSTRAVLDVLVYATVGLIALRLLRR